MVEGWELRFSNYLKRMKNTPFVYGESDCVSFVAGAVKEITGKEYKFDYDAEYAESINLLEEAKKLLGNMNTNTLLAQRGDVVYTIHGAMGIVDDSGTKIAVMTKEGMRKIPMTHCKGFWSCQQL